EHARRCGELLLEVKRRLSHGEFLPWLTTLCAVSVRSAQSYMQIARGWQRLEHKANARGVAHLGDLPMREALALLAEPKEIADAMPCATGTSAAPVPAVGSILSLFAAKRTEEPFASRSAAARAQLGDARRAARRARHRQRDARDQLFAIDRDIAESIRRE